MTAPSMVFREIGPLVVVAQGARPPTDDEWGSFVDLCRKRVPQGDTAFLVATEGGAPNARQRKSAIEALGGRTVPVAVVSDAPFVRGVVTAFGWFNPGMRAFPFNDGAGLQDALKYLHVEGFLAARVLMELRAMQREVGT